jgi:hypothetical protein
VSSYSVPNGVMYSGTIVGLFVTLSAESCLPQAVNLLTLDVPSSNTVRILTILPKVFYLFSLVPQVNARTVLCINPPALQFHIVFNL